MLRKSWMKRAPKAPKVAAGKRRCLEEMGYWDLVKILDAEFSFNLRAGTVARQGHPFLSCYTCGARGHWKAMDCGHFIGREYTATRWDVRNTRIQCPACNRFAEGEKPRFAARLAADGVDLGALQGLADLYGKVHLPPPQLVSSIKEYRILNAAIRKTIAGMN